MERGIALNAMGRPSSRSLTSFLTGLPLVPPNKKKMKHGFLGLGCRRNIKGGGRSMVVVVEGKSKKGMAGKMYQRSPPPAIPKPVDDNPRFLLFIRTVNVPRWYPLSIITGGTTAKLMVAAKDTFIGKYIYQSTVTRNLAGVVYRDEKEIQKIAVKQYPVLKAASGFQYGYKLIDPDNPNSALFASDVIKIPPQEELKPVVEKVKDFFGNALSGAKESFGSISSLNMGEGKDETTPEKE